MDKPLTVSEVTRQIKFLIESAFNTVILIGEISNFKRHFASGHCYFNLKDENAQISATLWNSRFNYLVFTPEDGQKVIVKGRITVYEPRGGYQIDVAEMQPAGLGDFQLRFLQLKEKLTKEGLFDDENKKELPEFPERVAIITSETGAVIKDFAEVAQKRYPVARVFLIPAKVQGAGSKEDVCNAIREANKKQYGIDVIVIARGGGSIEDLWTFNEEDVVRAVYESEIPIVSAIGHEVDFTLCDYAADMRAPTPSAAAEMIFPDKNELLDKLDITSAYLKSAVKDRFSQIKKNLDSIFKSYIFNRPRDLMNEFKMRLDEKHKDLEKLANEKLIKLKNSLDYMNKIFHNISPDQTLKRGFTYIIKNGKLISRKSGLVKGEEVKIKFYDGETKVTTN